jgi:hypothetical protein
MLSHEVVKDVSVLHDRLQTEWAEVLRARGQGDLDGERAALAQWKATWGKINELMPPASDPLPPAG